MRIRKINWKNEKINYNFIIEKYAYQKHDLESQLSEEPFVLSCKESLWESGSNLLDCCSLLCWVLQYLLGYEVGEVYINTITGWHKVLVIYYFKEIGHVNTLFNLCISVFAYNVLCRAINSSYDCMSVWSGFRSLIKGLYYNCFFTSVSSLKNDYYTSWLKAVNLNESNSIKSIVYNFKWK